MITKVIPTRPPFVTICNIFACQSPPSSLLSMAPYKWILMTNPPDTRRVTLESVIVGRIHVCKSDTNLEWQGFQGILAPRFQKIKPQCPAPNDEKKANTILKLVVLDTHKFIDISRAFSFYGGGVSSFLRSFHQTYSPDSL